MAFIVLRRSRNTRNYVLVESYRDGTGRSRKRTVCYLGREQDETDTLEKALAHWESERRRVEAALPTATGKRRGVAARRLTAIDARIAVISRYRTESAAAAEARARRAAQAEEASHWRAIELLRRQPNADNVRLARQAFLFLAKRCHPDQGGSHEAFIRLKRTYDAAQAAYRYAAA